MCEHSSPDIAEDIGIQPRLGESARRFCKRGMHLEACAASHLERLQREQRGDRCELPPFDRHAQVGRQGIQVRNAAVPHDRSDIETGEHLHRYRIDGALGVPDEILGLATLEIDACVPKSQHRERWLPTESAHQHACFRPVPRFCHVLNDQLLDLIQGEADVLGLKHPYLGGVAMLVTLDAAARQNEPTARTGAFLKHLGQVGHGTGVAQCVDPVEDNDDGLALVRSQELAHTHDVIGRCRSRERRMAADTESEAPVTTRQQRTQMSRETER